MILRSLILSKSSKNSSKTNNNWKKIVALLHWSLKIKQHSENETAKNYPLKGPDLSKFGLSDVSIHGPLQIQTLVKVIIIEDIGEGS